MFCRTAGLQEGGEEERRGRANAVSRPPDCTDCSELRCSGGNISDTLPSYLLHSLGLEIISQIHCVGPEISEKYLIHVDIITRISHKLCWFLDTINCVVPEIS